MTTFALESLFDAVKRRTYVDHLGEFTTVSTVTERNALDPKTNNMLVLVADATNEVDAFWRYASATQTWTAVRIPVTCLWGRREPQHQVNLGVLGRIVLVPNAPDGSLGALEAPEQPGREPRPLYSQERKFHFLVFGHDITKPTSQRAQDHVVEKLLHNLARNVYLVSHFWGEAQLTSPVVLGEPVIVRPDQQIPFGVEYRVPGTVQSAVVDQFDDFSQYVDASPAKASTTLTLGTTSRTFITEPE